MVWAPCCCAWRLGTASHHTNNPNKKKTAASDAACPTKPQGLNLASHLRYMEPSAEEGLYVPSSSPKVALVAWAATTERARATNRLRIILSKLQRFSQHIARGRRMAQSLIASMVCVGSPAASHDDRSDVQSLHWASALGSDGHSSPSSASPHSPSRHLLYAASDLSAPPNHLALEWHRSGGPSSSPASLTRELMARGGGGAGSSSVMGGGSVGAPVFRRGSGNVR